MTIEDSGIQALQSSSSPAGLMQAVDGILGNALGLGIVLVVFSISFYKLSPGGYLQAFTASTFTSTILSFMLTAGKIMPVELSFLFAAASVASGTFMYMNQRV